MRRLMQVVHSPLSIMCKNYILVLFAFGELLKTNSYYSPYLIICIFYFMCRFRLAKIEGSSFSVNVGASYIFSIVFTSMIMAANYNIWEMYEIKGLIYFLLTLVGLFITFKDIFMTIAYWVSIDFKQCKKSDGQKLGILSFFISLFLDSFFLFSCRFPGNMSPDSMDQIYQIFNINQLSNHHPIYHTWCVKIIIEIGLKLLGDINSALSFFFIIQIIFVSMSFSYVIVTLCDIGVHRYVIVGILIFQCFMPFNILYSITLWKDVPFAMFVMLFSLSMYRLLNGVNKQYIHLTIFILAGIGVCLFRSNGFIALIMQFLFFIFVYKFNNKKILFSLFFIIALSYVLKYPVLKGLNIPQPSEKESLSIPLQQIARVVKEDNDLTNEEMSLLNEVVDVDLMGECYVEYISDPVKDLLRAKDKQEYISEHKSEYLHTYIAIGLRHIPIYMAAYFEQTKGYYNSGYDYWRYCQYIPENELGIKQKIYISKMDKLFNHYIALFDDSIFQMFISIGVYTWITLSALFVGVVKKNKVAIITTILPLAVIGTLLLATPVFSEFRYAYANIVMAPVLLIISIFDNK